MIHRFISIMKKEFIHIKRDPPSIIMAIMIPFIFMLLFGYAVTTEVDHVNLAIMDHDQTFESRDLIQTFATSNYFNIYEGVHEKDRLEYLIEKGIVKAALVIPPDFSYKVNKKLQPETELIVDGSDPTVARTAVQSGTLIAKSHNNPNMLNGGISLSTKVWYNPKMDSITFTIPGLMGLIMQNITIMLTAFSLVREREKGTIEQLIVSPIKPIELILGKMIPYILIGSIDFIITVALGSLWFGVQIEGNLMLLMLLGLGFVICALAIGMLISTVASNQLQAMQMSFMILLPSVLLSGFVFPREAMPLPIYMLSNFIPLTYFLTILRGIIIKGVGISILWKEVLVLLLFGTGLLAMASLRFRKRLD